MRQIGGVILALLAFVSAAAADNTLGTWKWNAEKSTTPPGGKYHSLTITREAADGGIKQTVEEENAAGKPVHGEFTVKYDGRSAAVTGLSWDMVAETQIDANTVSEELTTQDGKRHATRRYSVATDGKTMTVTTTGTREDGTAFTQVSLFER
jgi:hypothetical protein